MRSEKPNYFEGLKAPAEGNKKEAHVEFCRELDGCLMLFATSLGGAYLILFIVREWGKVGYRATIYRKKKEKSGKISAVLVHESVVHHCFCLLHITFSPCLCALIFSRLHSAELLVDMQR